MYEIYQKFMRGEIDEKEFEKLVEEDHKKFLQTIDEHGKKMWRSFTAILIAGLSVISVVIYLGILDHRAKANTWTVVTDGKYEKVIYGGNETVSRSSHGITHRRLEKMTAVYFDDGRTVAMTGFCSMEFPIGTYVRISKNGLDEYRIEKIESPD